MRIAVEWLNEVGEAVGQDMFCGDPKKPGSRSEQIIAEIQRDAREGMVPVEEVAAIIDAYRHPYPAGDELITAFVYKHPNLFTE